MLLLLVTRPHWVKPSPSTSCNFHFILQIKTRTQSPLGCLKLERSVTLEPTVPDFVVDGARGLPFSRGTESSARRNVRGISGLASLVLVALFLLFRPEDRGTASHTGSSGMYIMSCRASLAYISLQPSSLSSDSGCALWEERVSVPPGG